MQLPVETPVVVILGPTAVGKTDLSIQLAKEYDAEIISVDSRYIYKGMDIGTAKPTDEEMQGIPHHLIDFLNPDQPFSLPIYQKKVYKLIEELHEKKKLPVLAGGTGQYVWSVVEGWLPPRTKPNPQLRAALEEYANEYGKNALYDVVEMMDPKAAEKIERNNVRRSIRALEVMLQTGELFSKQKKKEPRNYNFKIIGLKRERPQLFERVDERIHQMLEAGFEQEVRGLIKQGYDADLPSMSAIGYKEMYAYIHEHISLDEAIRGIKKRTRTFIRHQSNWFKESDDRIAWFEMNTKTYESVKNYIQSIDGWINMVEGKKQ